MSPRIAALLFVSLLAADLLPPRALLTNEDDADDHPQRPALTVAPKWLPVLPAEPCGPDLDDESQGPDLRRALFGDELKGGEGETPVRRAVPPAPATTLAGTVTLVRDPRPLR